MKSNFRLLTAVMIVLLGSAFAQPQDADAAAAPPMHSHSWGRGDHMMGFFADYLNLTDAQQAEMKTIMQKEHAAMKPLMQQMRQTQMSLKQYEQGAFDEAKVRTIAAQKASAEVEMTVSRTRIHNELFQVLTPEQQTKMKEMQARHEARMAKHMHQAAPATTDQQ